LAGNHHENKHRYRPMKIKLNVCVIKHKAKDLSNNFSSGFFFIKLARVDREIKNKISVKEKNIW